jgi:hypothetical protein
MALHIAQMQEAQPKPPSLPCGRQSGQQICNLFGLIAQERAVPLAGLTDIKRAAGQRNTDTVSRHRFFGQTRRRTGRITFFQRLPSVKRQAIAKQSARRASRHPSTALCRTTRCRLSNSAAQYSAGQCIACARHSSETGTPPSACRRIARIWGSLYLVIFIKIASDILPRKLYFRSPLLSGGIIQAFCSGNCCGCSCTGSIESLSKTSWP